jgi:hypothetical protein
LFLRDKKGIGGPALIITSIIALILVVVASSILFVLVENKTREVTAIDQENADEFLHAFLNQEYEVDGFQVSGSELVFLTAEGLDAKHLEKYSKQELAKVCQTNCHGEINTLGLSFGVGDVLYENLIRSRVELGPPVEVLFYVK